MIGQLRSDNWAKNSEVKQKKIKQMGSKNLTIEQRNKMHIALKLMWNKNSSNL